ncbi:MAG: tRNA(Ile)-lysidine synthase [Xanthobacteraceae bacterium]|nr:tRNA(Ile)-lysidine synthase [Xanthobacteraceae bacterium]
MSPAETAAPVSSALAHELFDDLSDIPCLLIAVSGGPDSTALLWLAARWRGRRKAGPKLVAVTVDHGLRPEGALEAKAVKRFATELGIEHRTLRWTGDKPKTGLQEAARDARYLLLARAARRAGARHVLTAHTLDDQAETVLFRLARGSGIAGLSGMARVVALGDLLLVRPLLALPKVRLLATLKTAGVTFAEDPSNRDPRFTRTRLRNVLPELAGEGLDAARFATFARRAARANRAIEMVTAVAAERLIAAPAPSPGRIVIDAEGFETLPEEIALRLLGRVIDSVGDEGPAELGKLESLLDAITESLRPGGKMLRRTLAGALVTAGKGRFCVERAPPRGGIPRNRGGLTTRRDGKPASAKGR